MDAPFVTIAIPCFNAAGSVVEAVESALAQTGPEKEIIVVDDGSTDDSLARLAPFGDRIRVISAPHRGGNHARNSALHAGRGEWIQYLDADDRLEAWKIERQLGEVDHGLGPDVIYSPVWIETTARGVTERCQSVIDSGVDLFGQWLTWQLPQTGGALWRRSALLRIGGWREGQPCCQEHELYLRALKAGLRFVFAPSAGAVYRVWSETTLCRKDPRLVVRVKTQLIDELRMWLSERGLWRPEHQRLAGQACFEMARTLAKHDVRDAARYHRERKERDLIRLAGAAAPSTYKLCYRLLGFSASERIAARRRSQMLPR